MARAGLFITLEGGEGAGKSTAAAGLASALRAEGHQVLLTREPGGTSGAEAIRQLLLGEVPLHAMAQTMLHFAARADHVEALIRPALLRGEIVICDRYFDSTMAYQAYGQGIDIAAIAAMIRLINLPPDLTFLLQIPEPLAAARLHARAGAVDRYESMGADFFARVTSGFAAIAAAEPERVRIIDAAQPPGDVVQAMRKMLAQRHQI